MSTKIIEMRHITKIYSNGFVANNDICFSANAGEIHALAGENGAGKTTLMKILFGIEKAEKGQVLLRDKPVEIKSPSDAIGYGVGMVHQHFMLVDSLTVAENMVLGMKTRGGVFSYRQAVKITEQVSRTYGLQVNPHERIKNLPVGMKQRIEILKALLRGAEILILDEPTAVLTPQETNDLFCQLKQIKEKGCTIIFISHKLSEIKAFCDRLTVLRGGRVIGVCDVKDVTEQEISRMMVGRDVFLKTDKVPSKPGALVLEAKRLSFGAQGKAVLNNVSFRVHAGEILGVAGVDGNGQRELSEMITGLKSYSDGEIVIAGSEIHDMSVKQIRNLATAHISEDRMTYGIISNGSIMENIIADRFEQKQFQIGPLLNMKKLIGLTEQLISDFQIKCSDYAQPLRMLSGGNMQKVVAAREFSSRPKLIIANQPTRGIDVGASEFIINRLVALRDDGAAVLLISADLNEVMELSDKLIVMCGGEITAYYSDARNASEAELGEYMLGLKKQSAQKLEENAYEGEKN